MTDAEYFRKMIKQGAFDALSLIKSVADKIIEEKKLQNADAEKWVIMQRISNILYLRFNSVSFDNAMKQAIEAGDLSEAEND